MAIDRAALADTLKFRALLRGAESGVLKSVSDYWGLNPEQELGGKFSVHDHADFLYPR